MGGLCKGVCGSGTNVSNLRAGSLNWERIGRVLPELGEFSRNGESSPGMGRVLPRSLREFLPKFLSKNVYVNITRSLYVWGTRRFGCSSVSTGVFERAALNRYWSETQRQRKDFLLLQVKSFPSF